MLLYYGDVMKKIVIVFLLLMLIGFEYSAMCSPMFVDSVHARALDAKNRPIQNVSVTMIYQLSHSSGKGYTTTKPIFTDENGEASKTIINLESLASDVDCNIKIDMSYDGKILEKTIIVGNHENLVDFKFDVYTLTVIVEDDKGNKVSNVTVGVRDFEKKTNEYGRAYFRVLSGDTPIFISYGGSKKWYNTNVEDDVQYSAALFLSDVSVNVIDSYGNPLDAMVSIGANQVNTDSNGEAILNNIGVNNPSIKAIYNGIEKEVDSDLIRENDYTVVFDLTPPSISSVKEQYSEKSTVLSFIINDDGKYSSEVDLSSVSVEYDIGDGWTDAKVFKKGANLYNAELGKIPENSIVDVKIYAEDNSGNSVSLPVQLSIFDNSQNNVDNDTENGSVNNMKNNNTSNNNGGSIFDLIIPIIIVVIIVAVGYTQYKKFFNKGEE